MKKSTKKGASLRRVRVIVTRFEESEKLDFLRDHFRKKGVKFEEEHNAEGHVRVVRFLDVPEFPREEVKELPAKKPAKKAAAKKTAAKKTAKKGKKC